jgi:hypothetical protein
MTILFLHGWQSTPGGLKPTYLAQHGHEVLNPALPDDDFDEAVRIAQAEFDQHQPEVVVGSSRGGAVAMNMNSGDTPLVLLCPAWKRWGTATTVKPGTIILHSQADEVVPFADSEELVRNSGLPSESLIAVGTEHRLVDEESLKKMLEAVERASTASKSFRHLLRCLLIAVVGVGTTMWFIGSCVHKEQAKQHAIAEIESAGGKIWDIRPKRYFEVDLVGSAASDTNLAKLCPQFRELPSFCLYLEGGDITDSGLLRLKTVPNMYYLGVKNIRISEAALKILRQALPGCKIECRSEGFPKARNQDTSLSQPFPLDIMLPDAPKAARDIEAFRSLRKAMTMVEVVRKCGLPASQAKATAEINAVVIIVASCGVAWSAEPKQLSVATLPLVVVKIVPQSGDTQVGPSTTDISVTRIVGPTRIERGNFPS